MINISPPVLFYYCSQTWWMSCNHYDTTPEECWRYTCVNHFNTCSSV